MLRLTCSAARPGKAPCTASTIIWDALSCIAARLMYFSMSRYLGTSVPQCKPQLDGSGERGDSHRRLPATKASLMLLMVAVAEQTLLAR